MKHIHGLELHDGYSFEGQSSAWNYPVTEYGVTQFPSGEWVVTLPLGSGAASTPDGALERAKVDQHERLWGQP